MTAEPPATPRADDLDLSRRYVRVLKVSDQGLVQFEFAIGWPDLAVELAMPQRLFDEFCRSQQVERLPDDAAPPALGQAPDPAPGDGDPT